jgi:hypothetical protein
MFSDDANPPGLLRKGHRARKWRMTRAIVSGPVVRGGITDRQNAAEVLV